MDKEIANSTMQFIVQIGVVGSIALLLAVGILFFNYKLGVRLVDGLLERFVAVESRVKMIEETQVIISKEQVAQTILMRSISENQHKITERLSDVCRAPTKR